MGSKIRKGIVVFNLHVQDVICLKAYLVHRVPQLPRRGRQVQLGIRLVVGYVFFRKIYL